VATLDVTGARHALLAGLIDHAALFPPASLPIDAAIEVDRAARATPQAWMLHRFLVPASKLVELPAGFDPPLGVIVDMDELPPLSAQVEVVEARLERAGAVEGVSARVFLEITPGDDAALDAVAAAGAEAKVRCGGATPGMFPTPAELAHFVCGCRDRGLAFKATAGLHHPIRCYRPLTYAENGPSGTMHGFLNLFLMTGFARESYKPDVLEEMMEEEFGEVFQFTDTGVTWRVENFLSNWQIERLRRLGIQSFGSCSFEEPVEDLKALGLL